ncbi:hypothetical protein GCM10018952_34350 [Streptosporangium vulgare]
MWEGTEATTGDGGQHRCEWGGSVRGWSQLCSLATDKRGVEQWFTIEANEVTDPEPSGRDAGARVTVKVVGWCKVKGGPASGNLAYPRK